MMRLKILKIPIIELHITNIYNREDFRHKSLISKIAKVSYVVLELKVILWHLKAMTTFLKNENR